MAGERDPWRAEAAAGAAAIAPMLLGAVPFGLAVGAAPVAGGLHGWDALGFSTVVFAGASQLAAIGVLTGHGSVLLAVLVAWTINLRFVLYSASLAPYLAEVTTGRRLGAAYLLTDQAYAVAVSRWSSGPHGHRLAFYLGAAVPLWFAWQAATLAGVLVGSSVPESVPLDFALPLVFLVLLVPLVTTRPAAVAAAVGGLGAVVAGEWGAGNAAMIVGAVVGIAAGTVAEAARHPEPAEGGAG